MNTYYSLGIDTSNYKTSVALVDNNGAIIKDNRRFLDVKKGERGLRQSTALFQHINVLPEILEEVLDSSIDRQKIACVSASSKPRPIAESYMPVFNVGVSAGKMLSAALNVPFYQFSHQEGHIAAIKEYSPLKSTSEPFIAFHFSGGTSEALLADNSLKVIGGSKDISYGQLLDRIGVALNMDFPSGKRMDDLALNTSSTDHDLLPRIKVDCGYLNLSGLETKCMRSLNDYKKETLIEALFYRISESIATTVNQVSKRTHVNKFIFVGGVSSSRYIRNFLIENSKPDLEIIFGQEDLSTDNAVGIALLGGAKYGR